MEKKKIIVGNWKMNPLTQKEAEKLFTNVAKNISTTKTTEIGFKSIRGFPGTQIEGFPAIGANRRDPHEPSADHPRR